MQTVCVPAPAGGLLSRPTTVYSPIRYKFPTHSELRLAYLKSKAEIRVKAASWNTDRCHRLRASASPAPDEPDRPSDTWLLEPVGDGDSSHIGQPVPLPKAFELASDVATVGRLPEKADIVIPVATVSGLHARLEKQEGILFVTDLGSTNGTYIDDKKLRPGAVTPLSPGSCVTFGDTHLAAFRFSKVDGTNTPNKGAISNQEVNRVNQG